MLMRSIYGETPEEQCQSKTGPNKEKCESISPNKASWGGAPTDRLSKRKPSDKASWGG